MTPMCTLAMPKIREKVSSFLCCTMTLHLRKTFFALLEGLGNDLGRLTTTSHERTMNTGKGGRGRVFTRKVYPSSSIIVHSNYLDDHNGLLGRRSRLLNL